MLSKLLIQFSVEGRDCVPSLLFDLGPSFGGGNEDNVTSFKRSHAGTAMYSVAPALQQATADPRLRQRLLDTHGESGSVSCGVTLSWVLCTRFCRASKGLLPRPV